MEYEFFYDLSSEVRMRTDFPNLYNRICNLHDIIYSYCAWGTLFHYHAFGATRMDIPKIVAVSFDERSALRYEKKMQKFAAGPMPRGEAVLPKPAFPIDLTFDLCFGVQGAMRLEVACWTDKAALTAFCKELKAKRDEIYLKALR